MKENQAKLNHFIYIVNCNGHFKLLHYYLILILFNRFSNSLFNTYINTLIDVLQRHYFIENMRNF